MRLLRTHDRGSAAVRRNSAPRAENRFLFWRYFKICCRACGSVRKHDYI